MQPIGCGYCGRVGLRGLKSRRSTEAPLPDPKPSDPSFPRKEVIQPHLPIRLPCYDFTPVMNPTVVNGLPQFALRVSLPTSGRTHSHGVTGGVYKTRERIHRGMLIRDY